MVAGVSLLFTVYFGCVSLIEWSGDCQMETAEALEKAAAEAAAKKKAIEEMAKKQAAKARAEAGGAAQSDLSRCRIVVGKIVEATSSFRSHVAI